MLFSAHKRHLITNNLTLNFKKSARRTLPAWVGRMRKFTYKSVFAIGLFAIGITLSFSDTSSAQSGIASIHSGGRTASGEYARSQELTAAHRSLPFGTKVRVTNYRTGRSVVVRINDRGPFVRGRIIDVTPAAARALGFSGLARVGLEVVAQD
jgi:rare lipoprotein A